MLHTLQNPKADIAGIRRGDLPCSRMVSPTRLCRHSRRLLDFGLIERVTKTYPYCLTEAGRAEGWRELYGLADMCQTFVAKTSNSDGLAI